MDILTWTLIGLLATLLIYLYASIQSKLSYWDERGVKSQKLFPFFGHINLLLIKRVSMLENGVNIYKESAGEKIYGTFNLTKPNLMVRDPEIIGKILVKDFQYFVDHNEHRIDKSSLFNLSLFALTGNEWRSYRNKLVPTFTSGKIKNMFDEMLPCADSLVRSVDNSGGKDVDFIDLVTSYALDISSNVVFGIEMKNEELRKEYKKNALATFKVSVLKFFFMMFALCFPKIGMYLGFKPTDSNSEKFFKALVDKTLQQRAENKISRNDYVQLLLNLKEKGHLEAPKFKDPEDDFLKTEEPTVQETFEVTDDILAAQALQFLTAGFDPVYNTMEFLLFELASNEEIQTKVRNEINECLEKNNGYTYKAMKDMEYLEQCISEALRKYPVFPFVMRMCVKDYQLDEGLVIEEGVQVMVSTLGMQRDPEHYPDPEVYDPDRFHPDATIKPFTYLPFGAGPRICIGMRFALLEVKLCVAKLLQNHILTVSKKTEIPLKLKRNSVFMSPVEMFLDVTKVPEK